jgi:hypothetical protein
VRSLGAAEVLNYRDRDTLKQRLPRDHFHLVVDLSGVPASEAALDLRTRLRPHADAQLVATSSFSGVEGGSWAAYRETAAVDRALVEERGARWHLCIAGVSPLPRILSSLLAARLPLPASSPECGSFAHPCSAATALHLCGELVERELLRPLQLVRQADIGASGLDAVVRAHELMERDGGLRGKVSVVHE